MFSNISSLVTYMNKQKKEGEKKDPQWTVKHPDWNKVVLVPVSIRMTAGSTQVAPRLIAVDNEMGLTSTKLVGGSANPFMPIKISVVYSKFSDK